MIYFKKSDIRVEKDIDGKTVLEVAEKEGIKIKNICREGLRGMCKIKKLSGEVSMRTTESR